MHSASSAPIHTFMQLSQRHNAVIIHFFSHAERVVFFNCDFYLQENIVRCVVLFYSYNIIFRFINFTESWPFTYINHLHLRNVHPLKQLHLIYVCYLLTWIDCITTQDTAKHIHDLHTTQASHSIIYAFACVITNV